MTIRIAERRKALGMTQPKLAEKVSCPYTQIQMYEHGRRIPSVEMALRLARALETTVEELFVLEEEDYSSP